MGEQVGFFPGKIRSGIFREDRQQKDGNPLVVIVVNDSHSTALSLGANRKSNLAYAATRNQIAAFGIGSEHGDGFCSVLSASVKHALASAMKEAVSTTVISIDLTPLIYLIGIYWQLK